MFFLPNILFLRLLSLVLYVVQLFGRAKLEAVKDIWAMIDKEEVFKLKTVNDLMSACPP